MARIHDLLNDQDKSNVLYKKVLTLDSTNIESLACLGAHYFYSDQVETFITSYILTCR